MKPLSRGPVNKHKAARKFNNASRRSDIRNVAPPPMRGGWRL